MASLGKGEIQLNGEFAKGGFSIDEVSFLKETIATGVSYVYMAAFVFAIFALVFSFFIATKSKEHA